MVIVEAAAAISNIVVDRRFARLLAIGAAVRVAALRRTLVCAGNAGVETNRAAAIVAGL